MTELERLRTGMAMEGPRPGWRETLRAGAPALPGGRRGDAPPNPAGAGIA